MYGVHSTNAVFFVDENCDTDLRGGNHVDVHTLIVKALKHFGCYTWVAEHAGTNNGKLGDVSLRMQLLESKTLLVLLQCCNCIIQVILVYSK